VNSGPLQAIDVPVISRKTIYPAPFSAQVEGSGTLVLSP
jgi:hypothetical protein